MKKSETLEVKTNKQNNLIKYIIFGIIFLIAGIVVGYFGATKYLEKKEEEPSNNQIEEGPKDITKETVYQSLISNLYSFIQDNTLFYDSRGISVGTMDNGTKLNYIYEYAMAKNLYTTETLNMTTVNHCDNNFIVDVNENPTLPSIVCTVNKIKADDLKNISKEIFNDSTLITSNNFNPTNSKSCIYDATSNNYVCGNILSNSVDSGKLLPKFTIEKVTMADDKEIVIYDKGYLVDTRDKVKELNDNYENHYLHSTDSTDYYYELKSADNLTFKHVFRTDDGENYYYVSSSVSKE